MIQEDISEFVGARSDSYSRVSDLGCGGGGLSCAEGR
jgi:hypothetical protein